MQITMTKDELYSMIKEAVREVIEEKEIHHVLHSLHEVSDEEMREITEKYGSPDQYNDVAFSEKLDI
jgi:predicted transcriptional regulator